jgi:hypothetical protein
LVSGVEACTNCSLLASSPNPRFSIVTVLWKSQNLYFLWFFGTGVSKEIFGSFLYMLFSYIFPFYYEISNIQTEILLSFPLPHACSLSISSLWKNKSPSQSVLHSTNRYDPL